MTSVRCIQRLLFAVMLLISADCLAVASGPLAIGDMYVTRGFDQAWLTAVPTGQTGWVTVPAARVRRDPIRMVDLGLPGLPRRSPYYPFGHAPETFMAVTTFVVPDQSILRDRNLGLMIRQIADNWEVYVNGRLVRREMHLDERGAIAVSRNIPHVLIPLNALALNVGENILAFRIVADPTYLDAGFYRARPLVIDDYGKLDSARSETVGLVLIFIYLFAGVYHLGLYLNRRSERYNLFYALFSILFFLYIFSRTHTIFAVISDSRIVKTIEFCSLYAVLPLILSFVDLILNKAISRFTKLYSILCAFLAIAGILTSMPFNTYILRLWQITAPAPLIYLLVFTIGTHTVRSIRQYHRSIADGGLGLGLPTAIGRTIYDTVPGNLFLGSIVVFTCVIFDILDAMFFSYGLILTQFGFFFFNIGITFILSNRFIYIHNRIEGLNIDLQARVQDLNEANNRISLSEQKYKLLVEGTNDIVFTMNEQFRFQTANKAFFKQLSVDPDGFNELGIDDILHDSAGDGKSLAITRQVVQQKLIELVRDKQPVTLRLDLRSAFGNEPVQMQIRLEFIPIEGKNEILGKATNISEDSLLAHLVSENQVYRIGNYLTTAEELSHRVTRNLHNHLPVKDINLVRLALREIVINAIEHGNLNISFKEKSESLLNDTYLACISDRQNDPQYRNRHVNISYGIVSNRLEYEVADEGEGFDHRSLLNSDPDVINEQMLYHGRGILLARNVFDEIRYNDLGNVVVLVKYLG